jgi:predicted dehydrogenase
MDLPVKVGIIGCGVISDTYIKRLQSAKTIEVYSCADLDYQRAQAKAADFGIACVQTPGEMLADPAVQLVANLTHPRAHADVTLAAIEAGKHVYTEKPFATTRDDAQRIIQAARQRNVTVCGAPDTFLQPNIQALRQLVDSGQLGDVVGGHGFFVTPGHESWHPNPDFYYQVGGGPHMDMGPYYLTALICALGPIKSVTATTKRTRPERMITAKSVRNGERIKVEVPTYVTGTLTFGNGAIVNLTTIFDGWDTSLPDLELYGTQGTITLGRYGVHVAKTPIRFKRPNQDGWFDVPQANERDLKFGLGIVDMVDALVNGRPPRASAEIAVHILDVLLSMEESAASGCRVEVSSMCSRPEPPDERLLEQMRG